MMLEGYEGASEEVEIKDAAIIRRVDGFKELGCVRKEW